MKKIEKQNRKENKLLRQVENKEEKMKEGKSVETQGKEGCES